MSQFVIKPPVIHIPSFKEYKISGPELERKYAGVGIERKFPRLDNWYYHPDPEGAATLLQHLTLKSNLYKAERQDCDWFALKAHVTCVDLFSLNSLLPTYGMMPLGPHLFCTWWVGDRIIIFEPNEGFTDEDYVWRDIWGYLDGNIVFELGENQYAPSIVLI